MQNYFNTFSSYINISKNLFFSLRNMFSKTFRTILKDHLNKAYQLHKIPVAYGHAVNSKGTRLVKWARKYRRPEDLEDPNYYGIGPKAKITSIAQSISARGFAKEQISYQPPNNVEDQLHKVCKKLFGSELNKEWKNQTLSDPLLKFKVLTRSIQTFKKDIPNSYLHKMKTVDDLIEYFNTPVDGSLHYDALVRDSDKLAPNLYVMPDSPTFNPETDTFFDGVTAFPGRKRIIHTKTGEKFEKVIEWPNI